MCSCSLAASCSNLRAMQWCMVTWAHSRCLIQALLAQCLPHSHLQTDDELRRLSGSGLAVVDLAPDNTTISADAYYLTAGPDGRLQLQEGGTVSADDVLGLVLFVCRPPSRDGGLAGSTSELLSL